MLKQKSLMIFSAILILVCFSIKQNCGAPIPVPARFVPILMSPAKNPLYQDNRALLDFIGGWIQQSDWFPIEANVPDAISGIGQGIQSGITNIGNGFNNIASNFGQFFQGLPFINRIPTQFRPRPYNYVVLMPVPNANNQSPQMVAQSPIKFNPFHDDDEFFAPFP